ncbi:MAG: DUF642 domain-containing protein [bacterium]|nr:DUF642 domain-containing protein [bacterium]
MRRLLNVAFLAALTMAAGMPASGQVVNGSFEPEAGVVTWMLVSGGLGTIPGWTTTDNGVEWVIGSSAGAPAPDGLHAVDLACYVYSAGGIQQTIATTPGEVHTVHFQLGTLAASGRDGTCEIVVDADGQSQVFTHVNPAGTITYAGKAFSFLADGTAATLRFRCLQNANQHFAYLDAVELEAVVTTEESTFGAVKSLYR